MKLNLLISLSILGCLAFVSCYPIQDRPHRPGAQKTDEQKQTVTSQEQQDIQKKRDEMKKRAEDKKGTVDNEIKKTTDPETTTTTKPKGDGKKDYAFANAVPGKEGFVFSPYNNKLVDVRDIPSGTLVMDPTYPASEKKYFRVP